MTQKEFNSLVVQMLEELLFETFERPPDYIKETLQKLMDSPLNGESDG